MSRIFEEYGYLLPFWLVFAAMFFLSTQLWARVLIWRFYLPPSYGVLALILLAVLVKPHLFNPSRVGVFGALALAFLLVAFVSGGLNVMSEDYPLGIKVFVKWIAFFATVLVALATVDSKKDIILLLKVAVVAIILMAIYGLYHSAFVGDPHAPMNPFHQVTGKNAFHNWNAGTFLLNLMFVGWTRKKLHKALWLLGFGLTVVVQVFTVSRFGWMLIVANILIFVFVQVKRESFKTLAIVFATGLLISNVYLDEFYLVKPVKERFDTISTFERVKESSSVRRMYGIKALHIFMGNPFFGIGLDNFQRYRLELPGVRFDVSHNLYFNILSETGLTGSIVFVAFVWKVIALGLSARRRTHGAERSMVSALMAAICLYLFRGITSHEVFFMPISGFVLGLSLAYFRSAMEPPCMIPAKDSVFRKQVGITA